METFWQVYAISQSSNRGDDFTFVDLCILVSLVAIFILVMKLKVIRMRKDLDEWRKEFKKTH